MERLRAIRLDSGDMAVLSKKSRGMLDEAGFGYVEIVASNQLDEYSIEDLCAQQAPIDIFGVGTNMICASDQPALDGIYKLCEIDGEPKIKLSETAEKINNPGRKKTLRYVDDKGRFLIDVLALDTESEDTIEAIRHPFGASGITEVQPYGMYSDPVFFPVVRGGELVADLACLQASRDFARARFILLPEAYKCFADPKAYTVGLSEKLYRLRQELIERHQRHG